MAQIKVENLTFTYAMSQNPSLKNISLTIEEGDFVTICGKSGCGKTTFLRCLKTILRPAGKISGNIEYNGETLENVSEIIQAEEIGFVMQNPEQQIVTDKVWHELAFGMENLGRKKGEIRARVGEVAEYFGIAKWYEMSVNQLSGGQKQLLNLASVMAMNPKVLILDEPTAQLDPIAAEHFINTLQKLNEELGTTIILSEHRLNSVMPISNKIVMLKDGEVIYQGNSTDASEQVYGKEEFRFMPIPMQIYTEVINKNLEFVIEKAPLTIGQGRKWVKKFASPHQECKKETTKGEESRVCAVEGKNIWFRYDKDSPDIVKGANLKIRKGEIYCLLGGNGAGKTTLLSIIAGIKKQYRGKMKRNGSVALLPQNVQTLFIKDCVADELSGNREFIENFGLIKYQNTHPYDLSGGEQQKLALAKVLLSNPDILLLDEPTKGLDNIYKEEMGKIITKLKEQGKTIVMVSHDIEFCGAYGDRSALFFQGDVISENSTEEFFCGNNFYTTVAHKMAGEIYNNAVTKEDVICSMTAGSITE